MSRSMDVPIPKTLAELKKLRKPIQNVHKELAKKLSPMDKLALWITQHVGTMGFFFIIFGWTAVWLGWNALGPENLRFDPYPAFVLWLFLSNMIQIFLMPLIMIGQNLQNHHAEARAEADYEVNKKAEFEIETILLHLENQHKIMEEILQRMEKK
ncbi:MAG: DUF1003 domain-containing protein [Cytophagales bacterium]|nr:DUF1003 domain-containing protein [Cytophagales bacterium]